MKKIRILSTLVIAIAYLLAPSFGVSFINPVSAIDQCDKTAIEKGSLIADNEFCTCTPTTAEALPIATTGSGDHQQQAYTYFVSAPQNLSPIQSAAIVGNMMTESGDSIDPLAKNGSSYRGIVQWDTKIRWPKLEQWAAANSKNPDDFMTQLEYTYVEFSTNYTKHFETLKQMNDIESATQLVLDKYEGAAGQKLQHRIDNAKSVLEKYGNTAPTTTGNSVVDLAKQMLSNPNIKYWTNKGVNTRDVVVALSEGKKAYTTAANAPNKEADMNPGVLQFILEVANTPNPSGGNYTIMVNALTDKTHSNNSNHYKGTAVDLDKNSSNTSAPISVLDPIAAKYGGKKNSETTHHHYDGFTGGGGAVQTVTENIDGSSQIAGECCPLTSPNGPLAIASGEGIYKSGLSGPYIVEQFVTHLLKAIAQKTGKAETDVVTQEHIVALIAFAGAEGGGVKGNQGRYNLFNTKLKDADLGGTAYETDNGRDDETMNYPTFDAGVEANARTMVSNKYQSRLISALTDRSSTAEKFMETLTYYDRYPGNLAWAAASDPKAGGNPVKYLQTQLSLVKSVRENYAARAGIQLDGWTGGGSVPSPTGSGGVSSTSQVNCTPPTAATSPDTATTIGNTYEVPCAIGSEDLGEETGYSEGNPYKIRLCAIPTIKSVDGSLKAKVNSVSSQKFLDLAAAAAKAGHQLVFNGIDSTFRSMQRQKELCYTHGGVYREGVENESCAKGFTAKPGHSNHQMGMAIDFNFDGYSTGSDRLGGRCKTAKSQGKRCELPESSTWRWMKDNAPGIGVRQLKHEYWHWGTNEQES